MVVMLPYSKTIGVFSPALTCTFTSISKWILTSCSDIQKKAATGSTENMANTQCAARRQPWLTPRGEPNVPKIGGSVFV